MTKRIQQSAARALGGPARRAVTLGVVVGVPASIVFLWLAVRDVSLDAVRAAFRAADYELVLAGAALLTLVYVFQAQRWRAIAGTSRPGVRGYVEMVVGAVACNNVIPGRLGELLRARWLAVAAPMPTGRALGTVGIDRTYDVVTLFAFLVAALPFVAPAEWVGRIVVVVSIALVAILAVLVASRAYTRSRPRDRRQRSRLRRVARDALDSLAEPRGRRRLARALLMSVLAWSSFAVAVWAVARSLGIELSAVECLFVTGAVNLGVALPSSPGFVGTYQWLGVASLGVLGVSADQALAFSILLHAAWYLPTTVVGGALLLVRDEWRSRPRSSASDPGTVPVSESPSARVRSPAVTDLTASGPQMAAAPTPSGATRRAPSA